MTNRMSNGTRQKNKERRQECGINNSTATYQTGGWHQISPASLGRERKLTKSNDSHDTPDMRVTSNITSLPWKWGGINQIKWQLWYTRQKVDIRHQQPPVRGKWYQMLALIYQTGGWHHTSPASLGREGESNQMTALRYQTGGWHETSPVSLGRKGESNQMTALGY